KRRTRTRAASAGSCSKPLYQSGCSNPTWNTASPANVSRSPPDARRTTLCPGVWPPVRWTRTPGATSYSASNGRNWLSYSQPVPHPVDEQPANVVHVQVGKHHVGHGCEIDAGGLQSLDQPPGPRQVRELHPHPSVDEYGPAAATHHDHVQRPLEHVRRQEHVL